MADFKLDAERLEVSGRLDEGDEQDIREWCLRLRRTGAKVVKIDLLKVEAICSRCIGVLVVMLIDLKAAGRRLDFVPSPQVKKVLDLSGLLKVFLEQST